MGGSFTGHPNDGAPFFPWISLRGHKGVPASSRDLCHSPAGTSSTFTNAVIMSTAKKTKPELWSRKVAAAKAKFGKWSARAAQWATAEYKKAGG